MTGPVARGVGVHVTGLRLARGWSQGELGRRLGGALGVEPWTRQAVSASEKGRRGWSADELAAVAAVFGIPPGRLFETPPCATCLNRPPVGFTCNACGTASGEVGR